MSSKNQVFLKKFCYKNNMIDKKSLRNRFSRYYPISGIEDISGIAVVNIVLGKEYNNDVQTALEKYFTGIFLGASITIQRVQSILPEKSGKYRFSICRIADVN